MADVHSGVQKGILDLNQLHFLFPATITLSVWLVFVLLTRMSRHWRLLVLWNVCVATFHVQLTGGVV
jgi:hypothetical protein